MRRLSLVVLAAVLCAGCRDQQLVAPPAGGGPAALIVDGAHAGNAAFFFLPPLVADPSSHIHAGQFNAALSPVAEVCELTGDPRVLLRADCVGGTPVFGPVRMAVDLSGEQYHLNWDTKASGLLSTKFYRIRVRGAARGTVLGFLDVDPVDQGVRSLKSGDVVQFQNSRMLPINVRIEQGAFGSTNSDDRVERAVPSSIPTGTLDVTTNTGFAGARFSDGWLPAGIDQVVVIIERIPVNDATTTASCLQSGLLEIEGCYRFRTDPDLHGLGPDNTDLTFRVAVIAGVCVEIPEIVHSDSPFQLHRRREQDVEGTLTPTGPTVALPSAEAPFLTCEGFTPTAPSVRGAIKSGRPLNLARAGWYALLRGITRLVTPRALYAVHFGVGGSTDEFSRFGWARAARMVKVAATDNQVSLTGGKVLLDPTVCLIRLHPSPRPLASEPVTFTVTGGGGTVGGGASTVALTGSDGCASAPWVLGSTTALAGNRLTAATAASPGTVEFMATGVSVEVEAGTFHACALTASGQAYCWGAGGAVGDGTTTNRLVPTAVAGGLTFTALSTGSSHTCGLTPTGAAYCWGNNGNAQLGDGTTIRRLVPTPVAGGLTFASLSAGSVHTCGVTPTGAAYCWGFNGNGRLGDGTTIQQPVPTPVARGLTFAALSGATGGSHTCGVTRAGAGYCWGFNGSGQLGDGTTTEHLVPTPVAGALTFAAVTAGAIHTCGVSPAGSAYCWGRNFEGQVGDGTTTGRLVPTPVVGPLTFAAVNLGLAHTCGATTSGRAYCWGFNDRGQLGDGTTTNRLVPTIVAGGLTFTTVSAGSASNTCGATMTGAVYCWGRNDLGQLGDGSTTDRLVPTAVAFATGPDLAIAGGTYNDRTLGLFGTAFLFDPTDPAGTIGTVAISGPVGWNGGADLTIGRFQPPGMAPTRSVWWVFTPATAVSGTYTAAATIGGVVRRASFSIDATSTLEAPQITAVDPGTSQVAITWTASPSTQSFLVRVNPVPFTGVITAQRVVSGDTRAFTFTGLSLVAGGAYQAVVWAYDKDVMTPGAIGSQFNIGAQAVGFTAPSVSPD